MSNETLEKGVENLEEMLKCNEVGLVVQAFRARGKMDLLHELAPNVKTKGLREALEDVLDGVICKSSIPHYIEETEVAPAVLFGKETINEAIFFATAR
jgi:hypothetical protein